MTASILVDAPVAVPNLPETQYHGDPVVGGSLSYTGMKELLKSPAHYRYYMDQPREEKKAFDVGTIVHALVLGTPLDVTVIPDEILASNGAASTKAAKAFIAEARADGFIPVKADEMVPLEEIAEAVLAYPTAKALFEYDGPTEYSMFSPDPGSGVWLRGRADKVSEFQGETVLVDLKTTPSADPKDFSRQVANFRYDLQAWVYGNLYQQTQAEHVEVPEMLFVAVSKTAPHLVSVSRIDWAYEDLAEKAMNTAIHRYQECTDTGEWPGYPDGVHLLEPPAWLIYQDSDPLDEVELSL